MTKLKSSLMGINSAAYSALSEFNIEVTRKGIGVSVVISGAVGISELDEERVGIVTHKARVIISGSKLSLSVFEGRTVEIVGRVLGVELKYGKG